MAAKPAIIISHGSWHEPLHWRLQKSALEAAGYEVVVPRLPSFDGLPHIGLREDGELFRAEIQKLVDAGKDVICVGHSYGGMVISEAPLREQIKSERQAKGEEGGVTQLIFIAAFLAEVGQSLGGCLGGEMPPNMPVDRKGYVHIENPREFFYHDVPEADVQGYVDLLKPIPVQTQFWPLSSSSLAFLPATYLLCTDDQAIPPFLQQMMVDRAIEKGAKITTEKVALGHSPYMVKPEVLVEMVDKVVKSA